MRDKIERGSCLFSSFSLRGTSFADAQAKQAEKFLSIDISDDLHVGLTFEMPVPIGDHVTGGELAERFDARVDRLRFSDDRFVEYASHAHGIARIQSNVTIRTVLLRLGELNEKLSDIVEQTAFGGVALRVHVVLDHGEWNGGHAG